MGTHLLLMDRQPRHHICLCLCLWTCPSLHLLSFPLVSFCASGNATGHPSRYPACGVPRWVQVPEGVIYATITLGTARPRAGMPVILCLLPGSRRRGACLRVAAALFLSSCGGPA